MEKIKVWSAEQSWSPLILPKAIVQRMISVSSFSPFPTFLHWAHNRKKISGEKKLKISQITQSMPYGNYHYMRTNPVTYLLIQQTFTSYLNFSLSVTGRKTGFARSMKPTLFHHPVVDRTAFFTVVLWTNILGWCSYIRKSQLTSKKAANESEFLCFILLKFCLHFSIIYWRYNESLLY